MGNRERIVFVDNGVHEQSITLHDEDTYMTVIACSADDPVYPTNMDSQRAREFAAALVAFADKIDERL